MIIRLLNRFQNGVTWFARPIWRVLIAFGLNFASFAILFALEGRFAALAGVPTFDTQNDLTVPRILEQLPRYSGEARDAYMQFAAYDFVFPFIAALFLAVLWTVALRSMTGWNWAGRLLRWNAPLLAFVVTFFDWLENIALLIILNSGPQPPDALLAAAVVWKQAKLTGLTISGGVTLVLLALALIHFVTARRASARV